MKLRFGLVIALAAAVVGGCASTPQAPVALSKGAVAPQVARIGIAMTALPKQDTQVPGASCLLCLAAASFANSSLTEHAKSLPYEDLPKLKEEIAGLLRNKGSNVLVIDEPVDMKSLTDFGTKGPNIAKKDFTSLRGKYQIEKLIVIDVDAVGFIRTYSAYIPTSDPKGYLHGTGYLVDLKSNTYDWYQPVTITKSADGKWDEPPTFPGLTNAYFQTIAIARDAFLQPFVDSEPAAARAAAPDARTASAGSSGSVQ